MVYPISPELYLETLGRLCKAVGAREYFSGTLAYTVAEVDCRFTLSVLVYHRAISVFDGVESISDFIPVWWEFHTIVAGEELLNEFSFSEMKTYLS